MTAGPAWRFSAKNAKIEERFGYARDVWSGVLDALDLPAGARVLDVGCGTGGFTTFLAANARATEIVGLDHDSGQLSVARARSVPSGKSVTFEEGDASKLPFPDASFDAVTSSFLLCVVPEPLRYLREMRRVVRRGGMVASLSCFCKSGIFPVFEGLHAFDGADELPRLHRKFRELRRVHVRNPGLGLPNGRDLDVWGDYAVAGLTDLHIRGFLTIFAPSDAKWSDAEAREYVAGRRDVEMEALEGLGDRDLDTLAAHGFSRDEFERLRTLLERKYAWLLEDDVRIRKGMELVADPAVLITGRVP